jgi:hypothetical protein
MKKKQLLAVMLLAQASLASAATTVYNDEATFLTHLNPVHYLEEFSNYTYGDPINGDQPTADFGAGYGYSWTAATVPNGIFPDTYGLFSIPGALTTYAAEDLLKITFTGLPVTALGGVFASTDIDGNPVPQEVIVTLSDNTSVSFFGLAFRGFTSDVAISYLTIDGVDLDPIQPSKLFYPTLDSLYVGVAAVPVPTAVWLFGSGLLGLLSLNRRRNIA